MAFASVGTFGTNNSTTSGTTLTLVPTATVEVGNLAMLIIAQDNLAGANAILGEEGYLRSQVISITDDASNVWHVASQHAAITAGAAAAASVCVAYCRPATQLTTASTITITFAAAITSKAVTGWEYTVGGDVTVERVSRRSNHGGADPPAITMDDLPSREYLMVRAVGVEHRDTGFTPSTNFTAITAAVADTTVAGTSIVANGEFRIVTATSVASNPARTQAGDNADVYLAFYEGTSPSTPWVVTGNQYLESQSGITPVWPDPHEVDDIALLFAECTGGENIVLGTANGFVEVTGSPQNSTDTKLAVFWCRATSAAMSDPVITDPGNHVVAHMLLIRGCHATGDPWDVTAGGIENVSDQSGSIGEVTTTIDNCLILWSASDGSDVNTDEYSAWANTGSTRLAEIDQMRTALGTGGGFVVASGRKDPAGATGAATYTLVTSSTKAFLAIALKPVSAAVPATVTPAVVATTVTVPTPAVLAASVVTPLVIARVFTVPTPTVAIPGLVTPAVVPLVTTVPTPTVLAASTVTPTVVAAVTTVPTPTITAVAVVSPDTVAAVTTVPPPTVLAAATVTPAVVAATSTVPTPVVSIPATVTPAVVSTVTTVPPLVVAIPADVTPATVVSVTTVPTPTVLAASVVTPDTVAVVSTVPTPSILIPGVAAPDTVAATVTVPTPTVTAESVVAPDTVVSVVDVPSPAVAIGAEVTPATVAVTSTVPTPQVVAESVVTPDAVATVVDVPTPDTQGGTAVNPDTIVTTVTVDTPSVTAASVVTPAVVPIISTIDTPSILAAATVTPATVEAVITVPTPTVTAASVVTPATVAIVSTVPPPDVITAGAVVPTTVTVTSTVPTPSVLAGALTQPAVVGVTVTVPTPTTQGGVVVEPAVVATITTVPTPTVTLVGAGFVAPATVEVTVTVPPPTGEVVSVFSPPGDGIDCGPADRNGTFTTVNASAILTDLQLSAVMSANRGATVTNGGRVGQLRRVRVRC